MTVAGALSVSIDASAIGSRRGGDERYVRSLVDGLVGACQPEDRVRVYVRPGATAPPATRSPVAVVEELPHGGPVRLVSSLPRRARRNPHELFVGYTHLPVPCPARAALIVTDLSFRHHPEHYPFLARTRLNALVPRQSAAAELVITLSEFCRRDIIDTLQVRPDRVRVVPCAVERPAELAPAEMLRLHGWAASVGIHRPFVLYLGNLHPRKNVARLIRAHTGANLGDLQLVIAGGSWWAGGGEQEAVASSQPGKVVLTGRVDEAQRSWLLRSATALAYPSLFEGFGLPPLEAMSVGTPVLTSAVAAIPEVCGDAALLVDPRDEESLRIGLERIVSDDTLRSTLRARGAERAASFSVQRTGEAAYDALHSVRERA